MNWRPEGWINHYKRDYDELLERVSRNGGGYIGNIAVELRRENQAFEEGADAILEALFKLAEESPTKTFTIDSRVANIYEVKNED